MVLEVLGSIFQFGIIAIASVIAIMNPASTAAVFTVLTEERTQEERMKVAYKSMRIGCMVLLFFAVTGQLIFWVFNLTVPAFQIAGGILLITVAMGMLFPKKNEYHNTELENISIIPLAFPLTCGPGTITTVILLASDATGLVETLLVFVAIFISIGLSYVGMMYGPQLFRLIGKEGLQVIPRLMAVIVLALAVQFILNGISDVLPDMLGIGL